MTEIARDCPAFSSGVMPCDDICMYAVASQSTIEDSLVVSKRPFAAISNDLDKAQSSRKHVILLIEGRVRSTRV